MLFSYVVLCDFFPLYDFESDKCFMGTEENLNKEMYEFVRIRFDLISRFLIEQI